MRYQGEIIDAHHHFWQPSLGKQPWLRQGVSIPFRYGNYDVIKVDYLPEHLQADAGELKVVGSVTMETEWELDDPVGEMLYTEAVSKEHGWPLVAVGHAQLIEPDVLSVLEQLAEVEIVRGIRNKPGQSNSSATASADSTLLNNEQWQKGFKELKKVGFSFDLQVAWWHFSDAIRLFASHPDIPVVINHAGLPADRSAEAILGWQQAIKAMSELEHVSIKVSGIGLPGIPWQVENNKVIVDTITENFGPERMMFASNFPVDSLAGSYQDIFQGFLTMTESWSPTEQAAAFKENALRIYNFQLP